MFDLRQLFARASRVQDAQLAMAPEDTSFAPPEGLEVEYHDLIAAQLRRLDIQESCVTVDVRRLGKGSHGFDVLVAMVRLHRWDRTSGLRLLVGLPMIEARVRKLVRGTWLADYSHFGGLWLHASEHLQHDPGTQELKELLMTLTSPAARGSPREGAAPFADSETD